MGGVEMKNVINLMQKMKEKETMNNDNRYIELLEKAVSSLSYNEQLEFKKLYDERDSMFINGMKEVIETLYEIEKRYNENMDDVSEVLEKLL